MDVVMYSLFVFIVICFMLIWYINIFNKYQSYIIRINEVETNIDSTLRKRFDLLNKSIGIIKANSNINGDILEMIVKLRSRKLTNFELDRLLYEAIDEFQLYREQHEELQQCESFMKIDISIHESESEIVAFRRYYNDTITDYNKLVRTFPSNLVAKISGYKIRPYFDGKDMNDSNNNEFKL